MEHGTNMADNGGDDGHEWNNGDDVDDNFFYYVNMF